MSVLMCAQRLRSFDEAVIFHQRRAISTDLNDLLSNSFESSPSLVSHTLSSISSSPSMETVMPPSVLDLPIGERKVCQVRDFCFLELNLTHSIGAIQACFPSLQPANFFKPHWSG